MATTYTPLLRLPVMVTGDATVKDTWGTILSAMMVLIENGTRQNVQVSIAGLTMYTLTTANDAADQARYLFQTYTGALAGDCTVTMPNVSAVGWALNSTTGGHNVILSAGGTTATIPPDGRMYWWVCDGATNVSLPSVGYGALGVTGNAAVGGSLTVSGGGAITGALTVSTAGTSGNQVVNFSQFGAVYSGTHGKTAMPGGGLIEYGQCTTDGSGVGSSSFDTAFSNAPSCPYGVISVDTLATVTILSKTSSAVSFKCVNASTAAPISGAIIEWIAMGSA